MPSDKINIYTQSGELLEAAAPVIISASRSTDIPAFYAEWFFNRLEKGYCIWYNPFNQKPMYISFANCKVVVFWTKNPKPIIPYLHELDKRGIHYYFQVTLNDYIAEGFEPNVPQIEERIKTFKELSELIGKERIIWRYDPIIITNKLTPKEHLKRIVNIGNQLRNFTDKLVFSFVDVKAYRKVQNNLVKETSCFTRETIEMAEPTESQRNEITNGLCEIRKEWHSQGWNVQFATCAEEFDYDRYGIEHNRCIDGELLEKLWAADKELVYYLRTGQLPTPDLFGDIPEIPSAQKNLKDKGQRKICGCMVSKDIGMYNTCNHLCVYCYANTSKEVVQKNLSKFNANSESIIG